MNQLVISGTRRHGISGTRSSSFREPDYRSTHGSGSRIHAANLSNLESFGFFLTEHAVPRCCEQSRQRGYRSAFGGIEIRSHAGEAIAHSHPADAIVTAHLPQGRSV